MKRISHRSGLALLVLALFVQGAEAGKLTADMKEGKPAFQSMGPLAFGPEGILFVADTKGAAIVAIATGDTHTGLRRQIAEGRGRQPEDCRTARNER